MNPNPHPLPHSLAQLVKEIVLPEVIRACEAANMPQKFIDAIKIEVEDEYTVHIVNKLMVQDRKWKKPAAVFLEYGTKEHWVQPRGRGYAMRWPERGGRHGSPVGYGPKTYTGKEASSKGHFVSGLFPLMPMHKGFEVGMKMLQERVK